MEQLAQRYTPDELRVCKEGTLTLVALISMSTRLFIHKKKSRPHAFFHLTRFEIFPQTCIFIYKRRTKYPTQTFIQDHTVIRATSI